MKPEYDFREDPEAMITALLLGELEADEAARLRQAIAKDAGMADRYERLQLTLKLVRETATTPAGETPEQPAPLKLSPAKREALLAQFKTVKLPVARKRKRDLFPVLVNVAAVIVGLIVLAQILQPRFSRAKSERALKFAIGETSDGPWYLFGRSPTAPAKTAGKQNELRGGADRPMPASKSAYAAHSQDQTFSIGGQSFSRPGTEGTATGVKDKLQLAGNIDGRADMAIEGAPPVSKVHIYSYTGNTDTDSSANATEPSGTLNLRGASVDQTLNYLSESAGLTIDRQTSPSPAAVPGTIEFFSATPLKNDELFQSLNQTLADHGLTALRNSNTLTVETLDEAYNNSSTPVIFANGVNNIPQDNEVVTEVIPVHSANPTQVIKDLYPTLPRGAQLNSSESGNAVVVTGTQADIRRLAQDIKALDSASNAETRMFRLQYADPKQGAAEFNGAFAFADGTATSADPFAFFGGGRGEGSAFADGGASTEGATTGIPLSYAGPSTATDLPGTFPGDVVVSGIPGRSGTGQLTPATQNGDVSVRFQLKNADANGVASELDALFPKTNPQPAPGGQLKQQVVVNAVPDANGHSVEVTASKDTLNEIGKVVGQMDENPTGQDHVYFYRPSPANPMDISGPLAELFGQQGRSSASAPQQNPFYMRQTQAAQQQQIQMASPGAGTTVGRTSGAVAGAVASSNLFGMTSPGMSATTGISPSLGVSTLDLAGNVINDGNVMIGGSFTATNSPASGLIAGEVNQPVAGGARRAGGGGRGGGDFVPQSQAVAGSSMEVPIQAAVPKPVFSASTSATDQTSQTAAGADFVFEGGKDTTRAPSETLQRQRDGGTVSGTIVGVGSASTVSTATQVQANPVQAPPVNPAGAATGLALALGDAPDEDKKKKAPVFFNGSTSAAAAPKTSPPAVKPEWTKGTTGTYGTNGVVAASAAPSALARPKNAPPSSEAVITLHKLALPLPIPQPEIQTRDNAFSTFSLNVSDVSFKLAATTLQNGSLPDRAAIRSEEFINAFDYRDSEPAPGAPIGFAWERAGYPFAHNRDLLRFAVKTSSFGRTAGRPLNLVLMLDKSGSMERADRVAIVRELLRVLAAQLHPEDRLSVVVFARTAQLWADSVAGDKVAALADSLSGITPEGGTNLEEAMKLAYETLLRHYMIDGENRVVVLTDGAANLGNVDPDALKKRAETNRAQGIALDCFGVGWEDLNDNLLEVLARAGGGRYGFINTPEEAATEFAGKLTGALRVAASDVKVQVEFNPARVISWRQIGYAKDQLKKEQFRDNTVKAAQLGAAEAGNGLYTVELNPAGDGPICTVHVRYRDPGTQNYHEHAWDVPYAGPSAPLDQASPAMRLAATASAFSEWLAGSPYAAEVTTDRLQGYLRGVPEFFGADPRPKLLQTMIQEARSISGR